MNNALNQVELKAGGLTVMGFSVSALATYGQVPTLDVCFDMGQCPLSAVPINHALGDHTRCLLRHDALRRLSTIPRAGVYYVPGRDRGRPARGRRGGSVAHRADS